MKGRRKSFLCSLKLFHLRYLNIGEKNSSTSFNSKLAYYSKLKRTVFKNEHQI
jgi:hypothetical protein